MRWFWIFDGALVNFQDTSKTRQLPEDHILVGLNLILGEPNNTGTFIGSMLTLSMVRRSNLPKHMRSLTSLCPKRHVWLLASSLLISPSSCFNLFAGDISPLGRL